MNYMKWKSVEQSSAQNVDVLYRQNHGRSGLHSLSGIRNTRKQRLGNWICFRPQAKEGDAYSAGLLRKSLPQSLDNRHHIPTAV
jgi:hypothetical protein